VRLSGGSGGWPPVDPSVEIEVDEERGWGGRWGEVGWIRAPSMRVTCCTV
jgi:hypothetical protein